MREKKGATDLSTIAILKSQPLTQVVRREIERMIMSGEVAAGARLSENALAARFSVSRAPIREACRALAERGFLRLVPNRGVFVNSLERQDLIEVYDMRAGLGALAGKLLAGMVTPAHMAEFDAMLDDMRQAAYRGDYAGFMTINHRFHEYIVDATGNRRLKRMYRSMMQEFQLYRHHGSVKREFLMSSMEDHEAIVEALRRRDAGACFEASFRHIQTRKRRVLEGFDDMAARAVPKSSRRTGTG